MKTTKIMKRFASSKLTVFILGMCTAFSLSFVVEKAVSTKSKAADMKRVTGLGGVFFKCKDAEKMNEWYKAHLGIPVGQYGASFEWRQEADPKKKGITQWSTFPENTKYFEPSAKEFMIDYRVENLEALVQELRKENVTIVDKMETYDYGKFIHIMDPEGNKIQLWEPLGE